MASDNIFWNLIEAIKRWFHKVFGTTTKENGMDLSSLDSIDLPIDFKETVELSDVVAYFKGLLGKIKQGEDVPFMAKASNFTLHYPQLKIEKPDTSLFLATYNEKTEEVENVLILEYKELGETLKSALEKSDSGIVTLS